MNTFGLLWRTVRYLRFRQLVYQVINRLRRRTTLRLPSRVPMGHFLAVPAANKPISYTRRTFIFLNQAVSFPMSIDWNYDRNGKLWTYNLCYFDYLNQAGIDHNERMTTEEGLRLISQFIDRTDSIHAGLEPYPTSLRITNWVHFLSRYQIENERINAYLFAQTDLLSRRLEYHLAGNHLLENGFALLIGALYFQHRGWFNRASTLIRQELMIQILADGAHDERSPMYHQILLDRLLDICTALQADSWHADSNLVVFVAAKKTAMLDWLNSITFSNGDVPMVNDAAPQIAPISAQIQAKARSLSPPRRTAPAPLLQRARGVKNSKSALLSCNGRGAGAVRRGGEGRTSGYRLVRQSRYELFADIGAVGPDHQPGHAHADTFSFVLHIDGQPIIIDSGTSTYEPGPRRSWERSTAAHNTVEVNGLNSSEVWGAFRVGRRASVTLLEDSDNVLSAQHDGYRMAGVTHRRTWLLGEKKISIFDWMIDRNVKPVAPLSLVARLHCHPDVPVSVNTDYVTVGPLKLVFLSGATPNVMLKRYDMANGFNLLRSGQCLEIKFVDYLNTIVTVTE